jgi:succinyl-diaminopimelate desuccinylase
MIEARSVNTDLKHLLTELVAMPTVSSSPAASREALKWIRWQLQDLPLIFTDVTHHGYTSLVITTRPTKRPKLLLLGHIDVVPGGPKLFKAHVTKGRLYGRGAYDMKFALACYVRLLHELGPALAQYDVGVIITSDEELGGPNGAKPLAAAGYGGDIIMCPDGASNWGIEQAAKAQHEFVIESFGKSGHGARPWEGTNAIDRLGAYLTDLHREFPTEPCGDPNHIHDTVNVGMISGGEASNLIAPYARAVVNVRTLGSTTQANLHDTLGRLKVKYGNMQITHTQNGRAIDVDLNNPYIKTYLQTVKAHVGVTPQPVVSHGATDVRYFIESGPAVIVSKPLGGPQHSDDEWVDLAALEQFYDVLRDYVEQVARTHPAKIKSAK